MGFLARRMFSKSLLGQDCETIKGLKCFEIHHQKVVQGWRNRRIDNPLRLILEAFGGCSLVFYLLQMPLALPVSLGLP